MGCPKSLYISEDMRNKVIVNVLFIYTGNVFLKKCIGLKELILLYFCWTTHTKTSTWLDFF